MLAIALLWLFVVANQVSNVDRSICAGHRLSLEQLEQLLGTRFERLALWVGGYDIDCSAMYIASLNHSFCTNDQRPTGSLNGISHLICLHKCFHRVFLANTHRNSLFFMRIGS